MDYNNTCLLSQAFLNLNTLVHDTVFMHPALVVFSHPNQDEKLSYEIQYY